MGYQKQRYPHLVEAHVLDTTPAPRGRFMMDAMVFLSTLAVLMVGIFCLVDLVGRVLGYFWYAAMLP